MLNGFWKLTWVEAKVFMREPMGFVIPRAIPVILFVLLGRSLSFGERESGSAGEVRCKLPVLSAAILPPRGAGWPGV